MEFNDQKPIYLQIADYILENILTGKWKIDQRIPSVRELAIMIEVNPNTVMRTYTYLQEKEIIYNKRGIGYHISKNAYNGAKRLKKVEFIENLLPSVFKNMDLLQLDTSEFNKLYHNYKKEKRRKES